MVGGSSTQTLTRENLGDCLGKIKANTMTEDQIQRELDEIFAMLSQTGEALTIEEFVNIMTSTSNKQALLNENYNNLFN